MAPFKKRAKPRPSADALRARIIRESKLFDAAWYLKRYHDVVQAGADPALHYLRHGGGEGRDPGPDFSTRYYLTSNPDVAASGMNALLHYIEHGEREGRKPSPPVSDQAGAIDTLAISGLFAGSKFEELSIVDPGEIARFLTRSATPAERLARVDEARFSPKISIIIPIYNTPPRFFREMLQSVFAQTYVNWEICMADDGSSSPATIAIFDEVARSHDPRIKAVRLKKNVGIAGASDAALALATGEFVSFLDHDDLLTPNALSEVVHCLRDDAALDFIYTDHVMVDEDGYPKHFTHKPEWSPEFLLSTNYVVHFKVVRTSLLRSLGGIKNEINNVQDLGVTCTLAAAGARVKYLPKPVYLWRAHRTSVALSTEAKQGIEDLLMQVYDRHLGQIGAAAKQTWPVRYRNSRTGVFQIEFTGPSPSVALVLIVRGVGDDEASIRARFEPLLGPSVELHVVSLAKAEPGTVGVAIESDAAMLDFVRSLTAEVVAFSTTTAQYMGIDWVSRLAGYAVMDDAIGAVGGKVLDPWLQVVSGGMFVDAAGEYATIAGGRFDSEPAHWFVGQVASNVDAISSQMMATRRLTLMETGGIKFYAFGDAAGAAYSAELVLRGYRIVYDPHSRHCDSGRVSAPPAAWSRLRELSRKAAKMRRYRKLGA